MVALVKGTLATLPLIGVDLKFSPSAYKKVVSALLRLVTLYTEGESNPHRIESAWQRCMIPFHHRCGEHAADDSGGRTPAPSAELQRYSAGSDA